MKINKKLVAGIGSALVDILIHEDDKFIQKVGAKKGGMTYVSAEHIADILKQTNSKPVIVPGGSACNTMIGISRLGGQARFIGKLGEDEFGNIFKAGLKKNNVESILFTSPSPTGRVLSIITPDAQRSMLTDLGASAETRVDELTEKSFQNAGIVHIEGYLLFNRELFFASLKAAKNAGAKISLDLASYTVVDASKDILDKIVLDFVDILIANEDEARTFTGISDETKALDILSKKAEIAVMKVGSRGSYISQQGNVIHIAPEKGAKIVDTTGAGDLWASGFLFGIVNGYSLEKLGRLASLCGYEACRVIGANIPEEGWQRVKSSMLK